MPEDVGRITVTRVMLGEQLWGEQGCVSCVTPGPGWIPQEHPIIPMGMGTVHRDSSQAAWSPLSASVVTGNY